MLRNCLCVGALLLTLACGSEMSSDAGEQSSVEDASRTPAGPGGTWWDDSYPADCVGVVGRDAYLCGEQLFWQSLQFEPEQRARAHASLGELTDVLDEGASLPDRELAVLHWRQVQLATALVAENQDASAALDIFERLDRARELEPSRLEIEAWASTFGLIQGWSSGDEARLQAAEANLWTTFAKDPDYVLLTTMGTAAALPLNTGIPQKIADAIADFDCATHDWCERETAWVPYQQAGVAYLFGEIYARVGDNERAETQFRAALGAPRAESWPYRPLAEWSAENVPSIVSKFEARDDSEGVLDLMEQNGRATCLVCHGPQHGAQPDLEL